MFRSSISIFGIKTPQLEQGVENSQAPQSQSRFARFSTNARTVAGSSVYSHSPGPSRWKTPKMPSMGFARRPVSADLDTVIDSSNGLDPAFASHSAASYVGAISQEQIRTPEQTYNRHPADVPLPYQDPFVDSEVQQLAEEINGPRRHRRRKRRKQHRADHWKRKRSDRRKLMPFVRGTAARGKLIACIISGTFLITVLTIYLAIALTNKDIGQEIHILFVLILLSITIFFCHSLIRLCMLLLNPPREIERQPVPNLTAPEGFQPIAPIPVRLARDDELDSDNDMMDLESGDLEKEILPPPPPAYGLWRSSVRADPNLLHWQRVEDSRAQSAISMPRSRNGSVVAASTHDAPANTPAEGPRPPSYVSEDGVSYITEAVPRSVTSAQDVPAPAPAPAPSGVHPAWRTSYVMSEIRPGELPATMDQRR